METGRNFRIRCRWAIVGLLFASMVAPAAAHAAPVWVFWVAKPSPGPPLFVGLNPPSKGVYTQMRLVPAIGTEPGASGQQWSFVAVQYLGATGYRIVNRYSGQCLAVADTSSNHAAVRQEPCRFGTHVWRFYIQTASRRFGPVTPVPGSATYQLQNGLTGKCIDVTNFAAVAGTRLQQFTCTQGWNQRFRLNRSG